MASYAKLDKQRLLYRENLERCAEGRRNGTNMTTPLFTRRQVLAFGAALVPEFAFAKALDKRQLSLILAPSNLGLRPEKNGDQPGTWRAPKVLIAAGLRGRLGADKVVALDRPTYDFHEQAGTRIRNGYAIRRLSLELGQTVSSAISQWAVPNRHRRRLLCAAWLPLWCAHGAWQRPGAPRWS